MNKIFKSIWNYRTQSYTAVSECQKNSGKTPNSVIKMAIALVTGLTCASSANAYIWTTGANINLNNTRDGSISHLNDGNFGFGTNIAAKEYQGHIEIQTTGDYAFLFNGVGNSPLLMM